MINTVDAGALKSAFISGANNLCNNKDILNDLMENEKSVEEIVKEKGISLVSDEGTIRTLIENVLRNNQKLVDDYKGGNSRASKALMGQVMKESKGSVAPNLANKLLMEILNEK